jgi:DNA-binding transcriptional MerR regulator
MIRVERVPAVEKAPDAFRTISEVAHELDVPQHVLRFWESRFREIRPMKRGGGRRYYRPDDVDLLRGIRHLLYGEGYTIRGVQRLLREQGLRFVQSVWQPGAPQPVRQSAEEEPDKPVARGRKSADERQADDEDQGDATASTDARGRAGQPEKPRAPGLTAEQVQKLQGMLRELTECRKLLDAALSERVARP